MEELDTEELNSKVFNLIKKKNNIEYNDLIKLTKIKSKLIDHTLHILRYDYKLITNHESKFIISERGLKYESYELFLKSLKSEDEKIQIDLKLKKWQLKTFWPIFTFAFVGFGFSICNFTKTKSTSKKTEQQKLEIEKMESELEKLQIYISNQKKIGSLSNSKVLKNIENIEKSKAE